MRDVLFLTLTDDDEEYKVSKDVHYINEKLSFGDSVKLFTKPTKAIFGNFVSSESGNSFWTTNNPNEVYELVDCKDDTILIDYKQHQINLRRMWWISPFFSLCFIGWFFYRRSGIKSPLIVETRH